MLSSTIQKTDIELLIEKLKILKNRLEEIGFQRLFIDEDDFNDVKNELDYLVASLYTLIHPEKKELQFDRKMKDKELVTYAFEFSNNLDADLIEVLSA